MRPAILGFLLAVCSTFASGQALYTATGPGSYVSVGVTGSLFQSQYGQRLLGGTAVYVDANLYRRVGIEAEARWLNLHTDEDVRQRTYLVGPKLSLKGRGFRPYAKFLVGRGEFDFPFGYAHGSYFAMAPGAGLDLRIRQSRVSIRVIDFEYQVWPGFSFGTLRPYGASAGVSVRVF